jgi:acetyl/propionyl-CoA carboxylase alpha subunit
VPRLLIANRGEIACRIIRSARSLGWETVAVHSQADATALHVEMADQAYDIGPSPARESYLQLPKLIEVIRQSGADAVHPGYGFLSESASFAQAVIDAGAIWVGPSPETISLMGNKQVARETAKRAGVPIVPGSRTFAYGKLDGLEEEAAKVGFPILIKACAGGGGLGMRQVDDPAKLASAASMAQDSALKAFGDGAIYLERYFTKARHIEVQVMGLGDGSALHLFERDCSLQRRFQKVVEESPAPGLPQETRMLMCEAALKLCRTTNYMGAGTIEFIVDSSSFEFFFLEMNTRIQVEHPVTEMVTGLDIVALQLLLATQPGQVSIPAPRLDGAAIECRLYAETPAKMFLPSPGTLKVFELPDTADGIRIDSGYRQGDVVTPFYDPMLAKIIAHGKDRNEALNTALRALKQIRVEGLASNRDFLIACLEHEAFMAGHVHTKFIEGHHAQLTR